VVEWKLNVGPPRAEPLPAADLAASVSLQARREDKERLPREKKLSDDKAAQIQREKKDSDALQRATKKQLKAQETKQNKAAAVAARSNKPPRSASKPANELAWWRRSRVQLLLLSAI